MPTNLTQGNTAQFNVEFLDGSGNLTIPTSGTLTITFTSITGSSTSASIGLTQTGSFFTGTWGTSVAAVGMAIYAVSSPSGTATVNDPNIRIVEP